MTDKKSILITGCSSGIGRCAAEVLQQRGYQVIASVRNSDDIPVLEETGLEHVLKLDLESSESIDQGLQQALEVCNGQLFALFNNGAYGQPGAVEDLSRDILRKQFETNVFGTHELTVKVIPHLLQNNDARIVQNSSILALLRFREVNYRAA